MKVETLPTSSTPIRCVHYLRHVRLVDGGVVRSVLDLCAILADRGHDVTLLTKDDRDVPSGWRAKNSRVPRVIKLSGADRPMLDRSALAGAAARIREADLLHLHGPWGFQNVQLARVARRHRVPYIVTTHGMLDDWSTAQKAMKKKIFHVVIGRSFLRRAACVHCTATAELQQSQKWFPASKTAVISYLFDVAPFDSLPAPEAARVAFDLDHSNAPRILFLSRLHVKKGIELLLHAAKIVMQRGIEVRWLIAGPGPDDYVAQLRELAAQLGVADQVQFLGMVQGEQKLSLYQAADMFVLPTSQENFGLVLIEALACATPVITTRGVDIWPELQQAGATIIETNPIALADAVVKSLVNPGTLREAGQRGREWVFDHLSTARLVSQYEKMYGDARDSYKTRRE